MSRNFGHRIAAGLQSAAGDVVGIMDADLQDPPEALPEMLERWRGGADYGVRAGREGETAFKRCRCLLPLSRASLRNLHSTGDFRLMDRKVVDAFLAMPERDRFVRGMVAWTGFRQEPVRYRRAARAAGEYPFGKMLRFAADAIPSSAPLRLAIWLGFAASGLALAGTLWSFVSSPTPRLGADLHRRSVFRRPAARGSRSGRPGARRNETAATGQGKAGVRLPGKVRSANKTCTR